MNEAFFRRLQTVIRILPDPIYLKAAVFNRFKEETGFANNFNKDTLQGQVGQVY